MLKNRFKIYFLSFGLFSFALLPSLARAENTASSTSFSSTTTISISTTTISSSTEVVATSSTSHSVVSFWLKLLPFKNWRNWSLGAESQTISKYLNFQLKELRLKGATSYSSGMIGNLKMVNERQLSLSKDTEARIGKLSSTTQTEKLHQKLFEINNQIENNTLILNNLDKKILSKENTASSTEDLSTLKDTIKNVIISTRQIHQKLSSLDRLIKQEEN